MLSKKCGAKLFNIALLLAGLLCVLNSQAQNAMVKGRVINNSDKKALIGVSIVVKNTNNGTSTDEKGDFSVKAGPNQTLVLTAIGFLPKEIKINSRTFITIGLDEKTEADDDVVVTALGIKRNPKALGYAATVVAGEQLTEAISNNWQDALSGKVAGLNLLRSNAGPVGSTKIILRGENNLTDDNQALIVVDGVVINGGSGRRDGSSNAAYGTGSDNMPVDYGSGLDDINPEDIDNITILKGAGAAALYGQRAANGAVIITTKAGAKNKNKGIGITVNSNANLESVNRWPDLQYEYGQGLNGAAHYSFGGTTEDGPGTSGTSSAYGPKFDGQYFYQYDPATNGIGKERTPWVAQKGVKEFFETGKTFTNSVSIDGGTDRTTARFSVTNTQNTWIIPNTGFDRTNFALSVNSKVNDKFTISAKVNYGLRSSDNLPGAGYGNQSLMYWFIFWQPNANIDWLKNYWVPGQENKKIFYPYSTFPENPYAISYEFINANSRNTLVASANANYQFSKHFSAQVRASVDQASEDRYQNRPYDAGSRLPEGSHRSQDIFSKEMSADFLFKYSRKLNEHFNVTGTFGGSKLKNSYRLVGLTSDGLTFPGVYNHSNNKYGIKTNQSISNFEINSFYFLLTASYKDFLYLDVTGRNDWTSTLASPLFPDKSKGFFYPSVNGSFILSEVADLPTIIDYAKIRASVSEVGSGGVRPYITQFAYESANSLIGGSLTNPNTYPNLLLEPLKTRTIEFGAELLLFKKKVSLDIAVYKGNTFNQHLLRIIDAAAGASRQMTNIGEVSNRGIEIGLNTNQITNKNGFSWSSMFTFSMNANRIEELADSTFVLQTRSIGSSQLVAKVGGTMGDLYGIGYKRSPDGQVIYDAQTGYALLTEEVIYLGNTIPKGKASMGNTFSYKGFRLNLLFDMQWGAVGHSQTNHKLSEQGKLKQTIPGRYSGIIGNGVNETADGKYIPNTTVATNIDEYYRTHWGSNQGEGNTFSTDFVKFREARLDYTLNSKLLKKLGLRKATVGVYGRNLFIWSVWPAFDPEFGTLDGSDIVKGFEIAQFPSTRSYGVNLTVSF
ncbi:SusC/RagA family TonB-linked outer membrane protein [Polluticaenibacter yanchengensis]|uniref:SusC/RagA family TonB-linked outer membrane protein n=1 Tax=Polluticaenibacter yanchengensis TaxID=3014562 RepID=A0ABT4UJH6_9BACT|nr:SusC/RagA family TonB-linked outer membrane protein [Chitinophagaceae bacterium LY-5]